MIILKYSLIVLALLSIIVIIVPMVGLLDGTRPEKLGIQNNKLRDCPGSPNCVTSYSDVNSDIEEFNIEPLPFESTAIHSIQKIRNTVATIKGITIITETENYIHAECRSKYLGFIDDLEVYCDEQQKVCLVRSASRLGHSDFGVNRKRVEKIRKILINKT